jgi:hypothetical protein
MKKRAHLTNKEDKLNVYSYVGDSLKYIPGIDGSNSAHSKLLSNVNITDCGVNVQGAISISKLKNIRKNLKTQRKMAFEQGLVEHS